MNFCLLILCKLLNGTEKRKEGRQEMEGEGDRTGNGGEKGTRTKSIICMSSLTCFLVSVNLVNCSSLEFNLCYMKYVHSVQKYSFCTECTAGKLWLIFIFKRLNLLLGVCRLYYVLLV